MGIRSHILRPILRIRRKTGVFHCAIQLLSVCPSIGRILSSSVPSNLIRSIPVYFSHLLSLISCLLSLISRLVSHLIFSYSSHLLTCLVFLFFYLTPVHAFLLHAPLFLILELACSHPHSWLILHVSQSTWSHHLAPIDASSHMDT